MQETKECRFNPCLGRSPGGGHGNSLQYSCLENSMLWGAWRATVHRVTKSWTWLKWLNTHTSKGTYKMYFEDYHSLKLSEAVLRSCFYLFLLYNIVLILQHINMNPPWAYTCSPSWTPLPLPSLYHPSGLSQCTSPKHPVSCIEPGLAIHFIYDIIHVSMPFSQIIPPFPSPAESKKLFYTSVSLLLSCIQGYCYHLSKVHIYALV